MAKHNSIFEETYDFDLIGICCSHSDYRLCWSINKALQMDLCKGDDYYLRTKKTGNIIFRFTIFFNEETHEAFYLIKNLSFDNYKRLIPEQDQIDYFMIIKDGYELDLNVFLNPIKKN